MAGNGAGSRKRGEHGANVAGEVRGAFLRAIRICEDDGRPLSEIIADELKERPLDTIRTLAAWKPNEKFELNVTDDRQLSATEAAQRMVAVLDATGAGQNLPDTGGNGPLDALTGAADGGVKH